MLLAIDTTNGLLVHALEWWYCFAFSLIECMSDDTAILDVDVR